MNLDAVPAAPISPALWETPEMRRALAARDIKTVFELLQRHGISQRAISRRVDLNLSEIYRILHKGRKIMAYDLLVRVADALGIPRGYMGLAYDHTTEVTLDLATATCSTDAIERDEVAELLSYAANVTMGIDVDGLASWWQPIDSETAPAPDAIGISDVEHIRGLTAAMRTVDYRSGGGACRDAIAAQVRWAQQLLNSHCTDEIRSQLLIALADLHNLAAWTSFDVGMYTVARKHFKAALGLARQAEDHSLAANILYRSGKLHLHRKMPDKALRFFQLGQITAQDSGCSLTVAMLYANEAQAYAAIGDRSQMRRSLGWAEDAYARAIVGDAPDWVKFFGAADLHASVGVALTAIPAARDAELNEGIEHLTTAIGLRTPAMIRSQAFELTALATAYLLTGSRESGLRVGQQALTAAAAVRSVRTIDRLEPLRDAASDHPNDADLQQLAQDINRMTPTRKDEEARI
ncbi:helix-turn-helix domain-containing protein [Nocardia sp. CA-119907]|uniref:helix-turn-helix domain-containing protein n=1 Tax=Nocardia sp. CA-119907 TaxID=3239973 RepID=UPI003D97E827